MIERFEKTVDCALWYTSIANKFIQECRDDYMFIFKENVKKSITEEPVIINMRVGCRCNPKEIKKTNIILKKDKILKDALIKCKCKSVTIEYMEKLFDFYDSNKTFNTLIVVQNGNLAVYQNDKRMK